MAVPFKEVLNSGKFIISAEVGPPKGTNIETMLHHIDLLKDKVDALNATDCNYLAYKREGRRTYLANDGSR
jgi:methylenetetrahydrofolate reductase (NADPH)